MKATITVIAVSIIGLLLLTGIMAISYSNREVALRNAITAKQEANKTELDNLKKKISQTVQVTDMQKDMLIAVITGNSKVRSGNGGGSLATAVTEAVPNLDSSTATYRDLMNIITGSRDAWTQRQKELLDLNREHENLLTMFPSSLVCGGRPHISVTIVTSADAKAAFQTGEDNSVQLH